MISQEKMCDTVLALINAGKTLPSPWNGKDPYDCVCEDFMDTFEGNRYDEFDWDRATQHYLASETKTITAKNFEGFLKEIGAVSQEYTEEEKRIFGIKQRTNSRMFQSCSRVLQIRGDIEKNMPTDEFAVSVGMKHGFTPNELMIPHEQGGQLLAIKQFILEAECYRNKGIAFNYKMGVDDKKEIVWFKR